MPYDYFVRITHPYESIKVLVGLWALRADKLVVFEHVGSKTEKIHCHLLILGSNTHKKQLRNIGLLYSDLKGNENCSFKECISWETPVVYMTKGELAPKYLKGFTNEEALVWKSKWVPREKYVKPNKDEEFFNTVFEDFEVTTEELMDVDYAAFRKVLSHARGWVFSTNSFVWSAKCLPQLKMLVYTYCFRCKIPIPRNEWSKWI